MSTFKVARSPRGENLWWIASAAIPEEHIPVRDATAEETDLIERILKHDAAGRMPPLGLGRRLRALLNP